MASLQTEAFSRLSTLALKHRGIRDPERLVATLRRTAAFFPPMPLRRGVRQRNEIVAGVPGTWFETATPAGTLLYLHGGAFICGVNHFYRDFCAVLAQQLNLRVFLADYRLAPEHPFPAAPDDAQAVYAALAARDLDLPFVLAGDSAGGNLTLVCLQQARAQGLRLAQAAVCMSPVTRADCSFPSYRAMQASDCMISPELIEVATALYLRGADPRNPRLSPLDGNFSGLPPILFMVSENECLRDDSYAAFERCKRAGVAAELHSRRDLPHAWPVFQLLLPEARRDLRSLARFVSRHIHAQPAAPTTAQVA